MKLLAIPCTLLLLLCLAAPARAQFKEGNPTAPKLGVSQAHRWKAGITVTATGGACRAIVGYVPVPMDWPEQTVKVVAQDVSPGARVTYQTFEGSAKLMVVRIPWLAAGEQAKAVLTFECNRNMQLPPEDKKAFVLPPLKGLDPAVRRYLGSSPLIEIQNRQIRKAAKETGANLKSAWDRVEALYDFERAHVKYANGTRSKGAAAALKDGSANHDDMAALFVALCRDADVPARMVWVPEFCYAEFYLLDKNGEGHWLPCSPAGAKAFGEMPDTKLILAKGDNFRPPGARERQRYIKTFITAAAAGPGTGRPTMLPIGQQVN